MKHKQLINHIARLKQIEPSKNFTQKSRLLVLNTARSQQRAEIFGVRPKIFFVSALQVAWRGGLVAATAAAIVAALYFATVQISPLFLPGLNQSGIIAEAGMVKSNIDVQLSHIQRFIQTSNQNSSALNEVSTNAPAHLNQTLIQNEKNEIDGSVPSESAATSTQQLNSILNTISQ